MSTKTPASIPVFASVMAPDYAWAEYETRIATGQTKFPKGKAKTATVEVPVLVEGSPDARAVRQHEMLHVAFTPDIMPVADALAKDGFTSGVVLQLAEDLRLAAIGARRNYFNVNPDDDRAAYYSQATVLRLANQLMDSAQAAEALPESEGRKLLNVAVATALIAMCGQPLERRQDPDHPDDILYSELIADNRSRLILAAQEAYGPAGYDAMERIFATCGDAVKAAYRAYVAFFLARDADSFSARGDFQREEFKSLYMTVHEALEVLVDPPPPPPPSRTPSPDAEEPESAEGDAKGDSGTPPPEERPEPSEDEPEEEQAEPSIKPSNKELSEAIDRAEMLMGKSLPTAAAEQVREQGKSNGRAAIRRNDTPITGSEGEPDDWQHYDGDAALVEVPDLTLNMDLSGEVNWAPMDIVCPPLERSYKVRVPRRGRPSLDGEIPRHWSRWFADRAILDNRGRRPGGTLLVDVSGSMAWSRADTLALINATPAMTIALYSSGEEVGLVGGEPRYTGRGFRGRLTIIARQGKAIGEDYNWRDQHGMSNACDGAALAWLARQPGPRVWFSDGEVTVMNYNHTAETAGAREAFEEATRIVKLGNITRTTSKGDVVRIFSGLPPVHPLTTKDCGAHMLVPGKHRSVFTVMAAKNWQRIRRA